MDDFILKEYLRPDLSGNLILLTDRNTIIFTLGRGFGLVVRAAGWHAGDPGAILGRDGFYAFGCIHPVP
jgi:hypothetical protein